MNRTSGQLLVGAAIYFVAIVFTAWGGITQPLALDLYLAGLGVAFAGYFLACHAITGATDSSLIHARVAQTVVLLAIVARLMMLSAPGRFNSDVSRYVWDGYLVTQGINPYQFVPDDPELEQYRSTARYHRLKPAYNEIGTVYGPVAMAVFATANLIPGDPEGNMRLLMTFGDIITIMFIAATLSKLGRSDIWVAFYALNPLLIDAFAQRGQMEGVLMPLIAATAYCIVSRRYFGVGVLVALATAAKINMVVMLPIMLVAIFVSASIGSFGRKNSLSCLTGFGLTALIASVPYWMAGPDSVAGLLRFGNSWTVNNSLFSVFSALVGSDYARIMSLVGYVIGYLAILNIVVRSAPGAVGNSIAIVASFVALLLLSPAVFPWYVTWCLPLLPVFAGDYGGRVLSSVVMVWSGTVLFWYLKFMVYDGMEPNFEIVRYAAVTASDYLVEPWRVIEYGAVAVAALWALFRDHVIDAAGLRGTS